MKIDSRYKPELIASKDESRYHICNLHLDLEKKVLVATDGHRLVRVPLQESDEHDATGPITAEVLKAARKAQRKTGSVDVRANGALVIPEGPTFPRPVGGSFPPYEQVIPTFKEGDKGTVTFGFNAHYLSELADALGSNGGIVKITVQLPEGKNRCMLDPIKVETDSESLGVLMPCRV